MPDIETQTENFIILDKEQIKKLPLIDRKIYKKELKEYKHEQSLEKTKQYHRKYQQNYNKMRYKYDPSFRMRSLESTQRYLEKRKNLKKQQLEKESKNIETLSTETSNIIDSFNLLIL